MLCFLAFTAPCPDINKTAKCKHVHVQCTRINDTALTVAVTMRYVPINKP